MNFSVKLKSIGLLYTLNGSLIHAWFRNFMHWKILVHIVMQIFQMLTHFVIGLKKKIILIITPISWEKSLSTELSSSWEWMQFFHNSNFPFKAVPLSLGTNTASCFLRSNRLSLFIFKKTSTEQPNGLKTSKNDAPWNKWSVQLITQSQEYFSETATMLRILHMAEVVCVLPLYHRDYLKEVFSKV